MHLTSIPVDVEAQIDCLCLSSLRVGAGWVVEPIQDHSQLHVARVDRENHRIPSCRLALQTNIRLMADDGASDAGWTRDALCVKSDVL